MVQYVVRYSIQYSIVVQTEEHSVNGVLRPYSVLVERSTWCPGTCPVL